MCVRVRSRAPLMFRQISLNRVGKNKTIVSDLHGEVQIHDPPIYYGPWPFFSLSGDAALVSVLQGLSKLD